LGIAIALLAVLAQPIWFAAVGVQSNESAKGMLEAESVLWFHLPG
jgi:hypothetical protein